MAENLTASSQFVYLYDADFAKWVSATARCLKEQRFSDLDLDNLIEEIEALSKRDKRELKSRLIVLLSHLLKYAYQPEKRSNSWIVTIMEQRRQILLILEDSPSLSSLLQEKLAACYAAARAEAVEETGLPIEQFPENCPFAEADILSQGWLP